MTLLYVLVDYKGRFGSKWSATPYRSGLDKELLAASLRRQGFEPRYVGASQVNFRTENWNGRLVLYTSSEDGDLRYKDFIEDILIGLEMQGAVLIPRFPFFRAHHNKVFMEILRDVIGTDEMKTVRSQYFGTLEEAAATLGELDGPKVLKPAAGSMSNGIVKVSTRGELLRHVAKISGVWDPVGRLRDVLRAYRHKGYVRDSSHRRKYLLQDLVAGLASDWKVLVFHNKHYPLFRRVRPNDFRASGSGRFEYRSEVPAGLLDFAARVYDALRVPFVSLDIALANDRTHLLEFQVIHFGTRTLDGSLGYFQRDGGAWAWVVGKSILEEEYATSIAAYVNRVVLQRT